MINAKTLPRPMNVQNTRYYTFIAMGFVTLLLTANVIGEKPVQFGSLVLPAGLFIFPLTYLLGDALTEVYGFMASRRVIWLALLANLFMALMCQLAIHMPSIPDWSKADAYSSILGTTSRLMTVSVFTYFIGEFVNTYIVAKLKILMQGRAFWKRGLCGSWIGELVETGLFIPLAFYGSLPNDKLVNLGLTFYSFKVLYAFLAMPLLNIFVKFLKSREQMDVYDTHTNFNPFSVFARLPSTAA